LPYRCEKTKVKIFSPGTRELILSQTHISEANRLTVLVP